MKEKGELKIKFKTVVAIILLLTIIILISVYFVISENNKKISNTNSVINNQSNEEKTQNEDFSMEFLKLENNTQNIIYSPLSIKYALKMLEEGAGGNTKTQIENVLKNQNLTKYENIDNILSLANGMYIRDTYAKNVKEDYKELLKERYNAEIKYDAFQNAQNINKWIEDKTLGIIKNMLSDDVVSNPATKMLLINALAIDMEWEEKFDDVNKREFYKEDGTTMEAPIMSMTARNDNVSYYKDEKVTSITMDLKKYNDTQLEFIAIMPEENLSSYIENFSLEELNNILEKAKTASKERNGVDISIPRFSTEYNLDLKQDLIKLGITDAFDISKANFSNISEDLYVNDALHKADIDFTEEGIKAAAVTVITMDITSAIQQQPVEIDINKPFVYIIRDKNTNEIWFVGALYEPESWEEYSNTLEN